MIESIGLVLELSGLVVRISAVGDMVGNAHWIVLLPTGSITKLLIYQSIRAKNILSFKDRIIAPMLHITCFHLLEARFICVSLFTRKDKPRDMTHYILSRITLEPVNHVSHHYF